MRTIKFRAKNLDGEWVYGFYVEEERQTLNGFEKKHFIVNDGYDYVKPETVGQYTRLIDENGDEIYEGDFLKVNDRLFGVVRWHEDGYFFIDDTIDGVNKSYQYRPLGEMVRYFANEGLLFSIIGNIHDNPELLKGGNK